MTAPFIVHRDEPAPVAVAIEIVKPHRGIKFERTSTTTIMSTRYPPLRAIVAGYLYEGFTVLAGRQKLGKTWLGTGLWRWRRAASPWAR